ncbi:MAG: hypothetical protein JNL10_09210 [Verrucomicrobiales bacterium]|nr:hypothetical protein [Verrucomicrobiales bacterium]
MKSDGHGVVWGSRYMDLSSSLDGLNDIASVEFSGGLLVLTRSGRLVHRTYAGVNIALPFAPDGFIGISGGEQHFLAIRNSGTVVGWGWGSDTFGAATPPQDLDQVIAVAAGYGHSLALRADGTVVAWGRNLEGQAVVPPDLGPAKAIAAGLSISMAVRKDGTVVAWGNNYYRLQDVPSDLNDVVAIDIGAFHALALQRDGTVVAWGDRSRGRADVPAGLTGVTAIAAGSDHSVALGIPALPEIRKPPVAVSVKPWQTATLTVEAAGFDLRYQWYRDGQPIAHATNPTLSFPGTVVCNAAGNYSVEVRNRAGSVTTEPVSLTLEPGTPPRTIVTWGESNGQGLGGILSEKDSEIVAVSAGGFYGEWFSVVLMRDGTVRAWGDNGRGQTNVPLGLRNIRAISAGEFHTAALDAEGHVFVWGQNDPTLQPPKGLSDVKAIVAGAHFTLALKNDGTLVEWGHYIGLAWACFGKRIRSIATGGGFAIAITEDGSPIIRSVYIPEGGPYDPEKAPSHLPNVAQVAIGGKAGGVVHSDGSVTFWGDPKWVNPVNQVALQQVESIAICDLGILVVKKDGSLLHYSREFEELYPRFGLPRGLSNVLAISGSYFNCAAIGRASLPVIRSAPDVRSVASWTTDTLEVDATGFGLNYLWYHGDQALLGETNRTLLLPSIRETAAGDYSVVVSNAAGAVTNRIAWLEVAQETRPGTVVSWGTRRPSPYIYDFRGVALVPDQLVGLVQVSACRDHDAAVRSDGTTVSWGIYENSIYGKYHEPPIVPPTGPSPIKAVAAGPSHALALRSDGTVLAWGGVDGLEILVPEGLTNVASISAGESSSWAIREDGSIVSWGRYGFEPGQIPKNLGLIQAIAPPAFLRKDGTVGLWWAGDQLFESGISNAVAVAAGMSHVLALTRDGLVKSWDRRKISPDFPVLDFGQSDVPPDLKDVVAIAAGSWSSMALKKDGTVATWGAFTDPWTLNVESTQPPTGLIGVTAIAAGEAHALALIGPVAFPSIRITLESSDVVISWPAIGAGYRLEVSPSLDEPDWHPPASAPIVRDGWNQVSLSPSARASFCRLAKTID